MSAIFRSGTFFAAALRASSNTSTSAFLAVTRVERHPSRSPNFRPFSSGSANKHDNSSSESETQPKRQHWTDGQLREILEKQNRKLWVKGIEERIKAFHLPEESRQQIVTIIEDRFVECFDRHQHRITDERSSTHLQTASLVAATHKVLMPFICNEEEVMNIIKGQMGETVSPMLKYMLTGTLYFSRDAFATTANRLKSLRNDLGDAVIATIEEGEREVSMQVTQCLYNDVLASEDVQHLASCCCCSVDAMWFDGLQRFGVEFEHSGKLSEGGRVCCYRLSRK